MHNVTFFGGSKEKALLKQYENNAHCAPARAQPLRGRSLLVSVCTVDCGYKHRLAKEDSDVQG